MSRDLEKIIENEKEWRRYIVTRLDDLEKDYNIFKVKAFTVIGVLIALAEVVKFKLLGK